MIPPVGFIKFKGPMHISIKFKGPMHTFIKFKGPMHIFKSIRNGDVPLEYVEEEKKELKSDLGCIKLGERIYKFNQ